MALVAATLVVVINFVFVVVDIFVVVVNIIVVVVNVVLAMHVITDHIIFSCSQCMFF